jgi:hypothetical protein
MTDDDRKLLTDTKWLIHPIRFPELVVEFIRKEEK